MNLKTNTPQLRLRQLTAHDTQNLLHLIEKNQSHLTRLGDYQDMVVKSAKQIGKDLTNPHETQYGVFLMDKLIGSVSLIEYQTSIFGLGYWIDSEHAGRGYTTEAVRTIAHHAFTEQAVTELWAGIKHKNEPSIRLVEQLGFELARTQPTHLSYRLRGLPRVNS